jgi:ornithine--oxo-acid transaminase
LPGSPQASPPCELDEQRLVERAKRLGRALLEATEVFVERFDLIAEVAALGLMWAIEFGATNGRHLVWRRLNGKQPGLCAQLVAVSLFREHRIVSHAAGIGINALKALPPLTIDEDDLALLHRHSGACSRSPSG